jgi:hypothetical protein
VHEYIIIYGIIVTWEISSGYVHVSLAWKSTGCYVHSFRYNCRLDLLYIHFRLWSDVGYRHFIFFSPFHTYCHMHQVKYFTIDTVSFLKYLSESQLGRVGVY